MRPSSIFSSYKWCTKEAFGVCWTADLVAILIATLIISLLIFLVYLYVNYRLKKSRRIWDDILIQALHAPLQLITWVIGISIAIDNPVFPDAIRVGRNIFIALAILWFLVRYISRLELRLLDTPGKNKERDKTTVYAVCRLFRIIAVVAVLLVLIQLLGIPLSGVAALGGGSAIIIGIGAKDLISNFFGGVMLYMDRPFKVGDWIASPDKEIEGTVEYVGWRSTRIRTFDKRPMYVPNSTFLTLAVVNPSRMTHRRIKQVIGVRYSDIKAVAAIAQDIEAMLTNHSGIATDQTLFVRLIEFADSSVNILVYTFTKTKAWVEYQTILQDVMLKIAEIIEKHGAEIAFPTQTVEIPEGLQLRDKVE